VHNVKGVESLKQTINIVNLIKAKKPDLYLVTIGASKFQDTRYNLNYAAKDAEDMAALFRKSDRYAHVYVQSLTDEQVISDSIRQLKSFFEMAGINDVVMLFIAGHGLLDKKLDYYYATQDLDFDDPAVRGIEYADIEALMDGIKALKKILFMDTCHSGELDTDELALGDAAGDEENEEGVVARGAGAGLRSGMGSQNSFTIMKELFTDLRRGTGSTVVSSAGGAEFAMESAAWKNGLFTYCLLNGISSMDADLDKNGKIKLSELRSYVREEVTRLSRGRQQPTSRTENITMDFVVW
jgi:uncharacterized caspase-like protein